MDVIRKNDVGKIEDGVSKILSSLEGSSESWFYIHFAFSKLNEEYHTQEYLDITINVIRENLSKANGKIFISPGGDIFLICKGATEKEIQQLVKDIGYSHDDDPQLTDSKGKKTPFSTYHPIPANLNDAIKHCNEKKEQLLAVPGEDIVIDKYEFKEGLENRGRRRRPLVLVVEDDTFSRQLVSKAIHHTFELLTAADGEQALKIYQEEAPDVTLLDIGLPRLNGLEVLKRIMEVDKENAYVVMLTANTSESNVKEAIDVGAAGYIAKPFTKAKIEHYLRRYKSAEKMQWGGYGNE